MVKRLAVLFLTGALFLSLGTAPVGAQALRDHVYDQGQYDDPYKFTDDSCGFPFKVKGRARGSFVNTIVSGSKGEAFLAHNRYRFKEVLTNPANGKKMYVNGRGYFREIEARHVKGDVWKFDSLESGRPFVVRDADRNIVLLDHGKIFRTVAFDTLGDKKPGGELVEERFSKVLYGSFPSLEADFDFCVLVSQLIG